MAWFESSLSLTLRYIQYKWNIFIHSLFKVIPVTRQNTCVGRPTCVRLTVSKSAKSDPFSCIHVTYCSIVKCIHHYIPQKQEILHRIGFFHLLFPVLFLLEIVSQPSASSKSLPLFLLSLSLSSSSSSYGSVGCGLIDWFTAATCREMDEHRRCERGLGVETKRGRERGGG